MHRYQSRLVHLLVLLGIIVASALSPLSGAPTMPGYAAEPVSGGEHLAAQLADMGSEYAPDTLGKGCVSRSPGEGDEPVCCVNGMVMMDGRPLENAEVQIANARGDVVTTMTKQYEGTAWKPFYEEPLSTAPLDVQVGEEIIVTARYGDKARSMTHIVQPGSQMVDVVLPSSEIGSYALEQIVAWNALPGTYERVVDIAVNQYGEIYLADVRQNRIQVFDASGTFLYQWGSLGTQPGQFYALGEIAIDSKGNVYVADSGNNRIQKFTRDGTWVRQWGEPGDNLGQFNGLYHIVIDSNDDVYTFEYGTKRVQKFTSNGKFETAWGRHGSGVAEFSSVTGLDIDTNDTIYVFEHYRTQTFTTNGDYLWSLFQGGAHPAIDRHGHFFFSQKQGANNDYTTKKLSSDGVQTLDTWEFSSLSTLTVDHADNLYIAADCPSCEGVYVQKNPDKEGMLLIGEPYTFDEHASQNIYDIAFDDTGNIFLADNATNKFDQNWDWVAKVQEAGLANPLTIAVDTNTGSIYTGSSQGIRKFDQNLEYVGQIGRNVVYYGLAVDSAGNIYATTNQGVEKYDPAGHMLASWGSQGQGESEFNYARGIAVDQQGYVYVTDRGNHRVQKFSSDGSFETSWGGQGNQPGQFNNPNGIAVDASNNVYVVDTDNYRIQKFTSAGVPVTSWGKHGAEHGHFSGTPRGIAINNNNHVYVSELSNSKEGRIHIFRPDKVTRPVATITHLSSSNILAGDTLVATGMGQDSNSNDPITGYEWSSDLDGVLGSEATLSRAASSLSYGLHTLTLKVRDSDGEWSNGTTTRIYVSAPGQAQWTMLLYLSGDYDDGGYQVLGFERMLARVRAGFYNPAVRIVAQIDGPAQGDTYRVLITPGSGHVPPQVSIIPYGEQAMDDPSVLANFVRWGQSSFVTPHYYLAIADHGQGVQGIGWDMTSEPDRTAYLTVREISEALRSAGIAPVDILHLDACSMGLLETAYELSDRANIVIASQYLAWSYFAYDQYQSAMGTSTAPKDVAKKIVTLYAERARQNGYPFTLSALDTRRVETVHTALNDLLFELEPLVKYGDIEQALLDNIWQESQKLDSNGDNLNNALDYYTDVTDWAKRLQARVTNEDIQEKTATLLAALTGERPFILANETGSDTLPMRYQQGAYIDLSNANGVSFFSPPDSRVGPFQSYVDDKLFTFTSQSRWPAFLQDYLSSAASTASLASSPTLSGSSSAPLESLKPTPDIAVSPASFGESVPTGATAQDVLTITNAGSAPLEYSIADNLPAWISVSPDRGTVEAGQTVELTVGLESSTLPPGIIFGTITVEHNTDGSAVDVPVYLDVMDHDFATINRPVQVGGQLLSLSFLAGATAPVEALATLDGCYELVYAYDAASQQWLRYAPDGPAFANTLKNIGPNDGLWIKGKHNDCTLHMQGAYPQAVTIPLEPGWNLVGINAPERSPGDMLASIDGHYDLVYTTVGGIWLRYAPDGPAFANTLATMQPGHAYWIHVTDNAPITLTVSQP
jgi:sugar lactone lactonase YvrE